MPVLPGMKCRDCHRTVFAVVGGKQQRVPPAQGGCNCPPVAERPPGWKPDVFAGEHPPDGVHHKSFPMPKVADILKRRTKRTSR
jgi:hypothetical protein